MGLGDYKTIQAIIVDSSGAPVPDAATVAYQEVVVTSGAYVYEARALNTKAAISDPVWQAWRWDTTGPIVKKWADGNANFDNMATNLEALSYS